MTNLLRLLCALLLFCCCADATGPTEVDPSILVCQYDTIQVTVCGDSTDFIVRTCWDDAKYWRMPDLVAEVDTTIVLSRGDDNG